MKRDTCRRELNIKENETLILSFGGSGGAEKINEVMEDFIEKYSSIEKNIRHIHATGIRYYENRYKSSINKANGWEIIPYIDNMPTHLTAADIVICRSGAMTIAELEATGAVPILIPSPNVTANHQYINAKYLSDRSAAILIEEKNLTTDELIDTVNRLKNDKNGRKIRAKKLQALSTPNASKAIVTELIHLIKSK